MPTFIDELLKKYATPNNAVEQNPGYSGGEPAPAAAPNYTPTNFDYEGGYKDAKTRAAEAVARINSDRNVSNVGQAMLSRFNNNRVSDNNKEFDKEEAKGKDETLGEFGRQAAINKQQDDSNYQKYTRGRELGKNKIEDQNTSDQNDANSELSKRARIILAKKYKHAGITDPIDETLTYTQISKIIPDVESEIDNEFKDKQLSSNEALRKATLEAANINANATRDQRTTLANEAGLKSNDEAYGKSRAEKLPVLIDTQKKDDISLARMQELVSSGKYDPSDGSAIYAAWLRSNENPSLFSTYLSKNTLSPGGQEFASLISQMAPRQRPASSGSTSNFDLSTFMNALGGGVSDPNALLRIISTNRDNNKAAYTENLNRDKYWTENGTLRGYKPGYLNTDTPTSKTSGTPSSTAKAPKKWDDL